MPPKPRRMRADRPSITPSRHRCGEKGRDSLANFPNQLDNPARAPTLRAPALRAMKVLSSLASAKRRHADCQVVKRKGTVYVICKSNPKFKARQGATPGTRLSKKGL